MEQDPQRKKVEVYRILWHQNIKEDLEEIPQDIADSITEKIEQRLSQLPHVVGQPLKGTTKKLWKLRFSKYRVVYTINNHFKEVWILAVKPRDIVYKNNAVHSLLKLAIAIHEQGRRSGL